ncbi:protein NOI4-like isoform X1 [Populus nigra]|uniref:protein NOI4-like isoform X1 n=1 Tax=Populus nigra TaxID=3691 RepID=UPI002B26EBB4|nr:protein NOI4-like isoform X1 [Populus nigra]
MIEYRQAHLKPISHCLSLQKAHAVSLSLAVYRFPASPESLSLEFMSDTGRPLPKFGEWDVNDPASAEGFTVIFNKARDEKKTGGQPESPGKVVDSHVKPGLNPAKSQPKKWFCCIQSPHVES